MYLSEVDKPASGDRTAPSPTTRVAATVLALGTVSLITDVSAEMVTAVLPLYLMLGLHLGPLGYGVIDGLYTGATALLRLVGGYLADRVRRRKAVALTGYGASAVAKLGLLAAGSSVPVLSAVIVADRAGKGLRTAPRDALITLSTPPDRLGRAFGVHRAMDSVGAFAGPLVALAVLAASAQSFDAVFVTSFCIAALGVFVLAAFVPEHRGPEHHRPAPGGAVPAAATTATGAGTGAAIGPATGAGTGAVIGPGTATATRRSVSPRAALALLRRRDFRLVVLAATVLGLATIGDGFVYLILQRRYDLAAGWFPLLAVGTSLSYLLLAIPVGHLADRVGRGRVYLGGYGALVAVYLILAAGLGGMATLVITIALYGAFYAMTDGVLMAVAGPLLPEALRTTGIALVQSGQSLAYLVSSILFGAAWQLCGPGPALLAGAGMAAAALAVVARVLPGTPRATAGGKGAATGA
ncbi:MFS transporter [Plantactinospora sp. KBS50]|uniref:MFS transporter n=1 Tax=Plantactinospora sp. KBS50 TaxID=2024580 RepID=UPI000BAAEE9D|nr:MFS transporter [Plantactinospora sp. KBS50]ASW57152.1 MFS transporter [Plantactinospora sp. KBS50]